MGYGDWTLPSLTGTTINSRKTLTAELIMLATSNSWIINAGDDQSELVATGPNVYDRITQLRSTESGATIYVILRSLYRDGSNTDRGRLQFYVSDVATGMTSSNIRGWTAATSVSSYAEMTVDEHDNNGSQDYRYWAHISSTRMVAFQYSMNRSPDQYEGVYVGSLARFSASTASRGKSGQLNPWIVYNLGKASMESRHNAKNATDKTAPRILWNSGSNKNNGSGQFPREKAGFNAPIEQQNLDSNIFNNSDPNQIETYTQSRQFFSFPILISDPGDPGSGDNPYADMHGMFDGLEKIRIDKDGSDGIIREDVVLFSNAGETAVVIPMSGNNDDNECYALYGCTSLNTPVDMGYRPFDASNLAMPRNGFITSFASFTNPNFVFLCSRPSGLLLTGDSTWQRSRIYDDDNNLVLVLHATALDNIESVKVQEIKVTY